MRATHGECDALFVAVEGGLSYEVFLLGLADGLTGLEPDVLGRHVVPAEALLRALPRLCDFLAPRFLIRATSVQQRLRSQGLPACQCSAHVWSGLLDRLKLAKLAPREELQGKVRDLQRRFLQLAKAREAMPHPSADASLIAAEIGSLLDALALRAPAKSRGPKAPSSLAKSDWEVEDLRRIAANPGLGLQALSNGIKVIAGLQQLLRARYPGPGSDLSGQAEEELLLCAFRSDAPGCGAVDSPNAFHTPSMPSTPTGAASTGSCVPCSAIHLQGALASSRFQELGVNQAASSAQSGLLRTSASHGRLPTPVRSESVPADELEITESASSRKPVPELPQSKLQPPSSWQSILCGRASRWSNGASSCSTSPGSLASLRRRGSEPPGRKSEGFLATPRNSTGAGAAQAVQAVRRGSGPGSYFDRMRARALARVASKSPGRDPSIAEAVRRAQSRAKRAQQQQAQKDAADAKARTGPTGELLAPATASLFKRRDERLQRFAQRQENVTASEMSELATIESPQPLPSPEPCP
ncbi:unnamed protein product [Symbiodinium sp. CCMP2592]|nr:unnamed protein product [Symbiodinium sp. CCMP2592]